jgi:hypothetical protein
MQRSSPTAVCLRWHATTRRQSTRDRIIRAPR